MKKINTWEGDYWLSIQENRKLGRNLKRLLKK